MYVKGSVACFRVALLIGLEWKKKQAHFKPFGTLAELHLKGHVYE